MKKLTYCTFFIFIFFVLNFYNCKNYEDRTCNIYQNKYKESGSLDNKIYKEEKEGIAIQFMKGIIPRNIDSKDSKLVVCKEKLDNLKKGIIEYKKIDKKNIMFSKTPNLVHKILYSKQTPMQSGDNVENFATICDFEMKKKDISSTIIQKDEKFEKKINSVLLGEADYNGYLRTLIHGHKEQEDIDTIWNFFIIDKLEWAVTLLCNKARTVANDSKRLNDLFDKNEKLQQTIKSNIDLQHKFFISYFDLIKSNKHQTVDHMINVSEYLKNNNIPISQKNEIYFKAFVESLKKKFDFLVQRISKNKSSKITSIKTKVFDITDTLVKMDPKGQSIVEFTKLFYKNTVVHNGTSKFFKSNLNGNVSKNMSANEIITNMEKPLKLLKRVMDNFLAREAVVAMSNKISYKDKEKSNRLRQLVRVIVVYLEFGICCLDYLKNCKKEEILDRIVNG